MITILEAKTRIQQHNIRTNSVQKPLTESLTYVLSQDIISPISLPSFNQSAMDGYAICSENDTTNTFKVVTEVKAGDTYLEVLKTGECARIFTGAMIPEGTTSVVMQEKVVLKDELILIQEKIKKGDNIRFIGEQIQKGQIALNKGTYLNSAGIGFLSGLGITQISVFEKTTVSLIVTGNELTPAFISSSLRWV